MPNIKTAMQDEQEPNLDDAQNADDHSPAPAQHHHERADGAVGATSDGT